MNKWHISSKRNLILSLFILPFAILSLPIFLGSYFMLLSDFLIHPSFDLLGGLILLSICSIPWIFGTLIIYAHISIGFSVYKLTEEGVIVGLFKKRLLHWNSAVFIEEVPFAVGKLQSYFGSKKKVAFLFFVDDVSYDYVAYAKKYGMSTLLLFQWFRFLGKPGAWMVWFWVECMLEDMEVSIITPPREIVWFECNEQMIRNIKQLVYI